MISKANIEEAMQDAWLEAFKDRLKNFYNNEVVEDSATADKQLRNSLTELKKALAESVTIVDEILFPKTE
jgi:hypothetical protein